MLFRSDRKSTRLNSSHTLISYAVFCLKKKKKQPPCTGNEHVNANARITATHTASHPPPPAHSRVVVAIHPRAQPLRASFFFFLMIGRPPRSTLFPYTTPFR